MAEAKTQRRKSVARGARKAEKETLSPPRKPGARTLDSYQNLITRTGFGTENQSSYGSYGFYPITRMRQVLDFAYRSSWVCRAACQTVAEDMTREGFDLGAEIGPDEAGVIHNAFDKTYAIWDKFRETIQWARLFGGAGAVVMIDGQKFSDPLRLETVGKDSFCGLVPLDRWLVNSSLNDLVTDMRSLDFGKPKFYTTVGDTPLPGGTKIHHTRFLRFEGDDLSYYMKLSENLWGMSVLEPIWDRLLAFDSTTAGAAQLVYRAHNRVLSIEGWTETVGTGGDLLDAQLAAIDWMRRFMNNEGVTVIDAQNRLEALQYSFTGLDSVLIQMGQQISGALQIPLVRLFGQSPAGLNSSGESDLRTYYDMIRAQQQRKFRTKIETVLRIVARSLGIKIADNFNFGFNPLWLMTEEQKSGVASTRSGAVTSVFEAGIIGRKTALKELRQQSRSTGVFTNISDEEIEAAEEDPPQPVIEGAGEGLEGGSGARPGEDPDNFLPPAPRPAERRAGRSRPAFLPGGMRTILGAGGEEEGDSAGAFMGGELERADRRGHLPLSEGRPRGYRRPNRHGTPPAVHQPIVHIHAGDRDLPGRETEFCGHRVVVEVERGQSRTAGSSGGALMAAPYGYFPGTIGNDGDAVDVFLGENPRSNVVYIVDQNNPDGEFHQHKVFLGFGKATDALDVFERFYADGRGRERLGRVREMTLPAFGRWLEDYRRPLDRAAAGV